MAKYTEDGCLFMEGIDKKCLHGNLSKPRGLVLHITMGTKRGDKIYLSNPQGLLATFNDTSYAAHFGIFRDGAIYQYVDTSTVTWAQDASDWVSVECSGYTGQELNDSQLETVGGLFAWLSHTYPDSVALQVADGRSDSGLAYHSLFLTDDERKGHKGHWYCPGDPVINQRPKIVARAQEIAAKKWPSESAWTPPSGAGTHAGGPQDVVGP